MPRVRKSKALTTHCRFVGPVRDGRDLCREIGGVCSILLFDG